MRSIFTQLPGAALTPVTVEDLFSPTAFVSWLSPCWFREANFRAAFRTPRLPFVLKQLGFWDGVQGPPGLRSSSLWPLLSFLPFFFSLFVIQVLTHGGRMDSSSYFFLLTFLQVCRFPDNSSGRRVRLPPFSVCVCHYPCLHMSLAGRVPSRFLSDCIFVFALEREYKLFSPLKSAQNESCN